MLQTTNTKTPWYVYVNIVAVSLSLFTLYLAVHGPWWEVVDLFLVGLMLIAIYFLLPLFGLCTLHTIFLFIRARIEFKKTRNSDLFKWPLIISMLWFITLVIAYFSILKSLLF